MDTLTDIGPCKSQVPQPETEARYRKALDLYRTTTLPVSAICKQTNTPFVAFRTYIHRCHRELMFARHGIHLSPDEAKATRLRKPNGQTVASYIKYKEAIRACDDRTYIEYNVSQIARIFHLNPSALSNQLRVHYPDILKRRERERCRIGLNDHLHRGVKAWCKEQYAEAAEHLRTTDDTLEQTANLYNLSYSGLREHLLYYHKDLVRKRADKRKQAIANKHIGELTGNGVRHEPSPKQVEKYREAVHLYRTTAMTQQDIAEATGVSANGLCNYLRMWHPELILEHRGVTHSKETEIRISETKSYLKCTAAKYAEAINRLKATGCSTAEVAKEFGLHPDIFRTYLHEHEPELAADLGMTRLPNGKRVSARSTKKYAETVRLYASTTEPLRSIALRLGVQYNSVNSFIRRNYPDAIQNHNRLLMQEEETKRAKASSYEKK